MRVDPTLGGAVRRWKCAQNLHVVTTYLRCNITTTPQPRGSHWGILVDSLCVSDYQQPPPRGSRGGISVNLFRARPFLSAKAHSKCPLRLMGGSELQQWMITLRLIKIPSVTVVATLAGLSPVFAQTSAAR